MIDRVLWELLQPCTSVSKQNASGAMTIYQCTKQIVFVASTALSFLLVVYRVRSIQLISLTSSDRLFFCISDVAPQRGILSATRNFRIHWKRAGSTDAKVQILSHAHAVEV